VSSFAPFLIASEAARRLGVSTKALRIYEQRGLVAPDRTAAGYRVYGPDEMARAAEIVALRALGLSLSQVARVLEGDPRSLELALAAHEGALEGEIRKLVNTIDKVRGFRAGLAQGHAPAAGELARLLSPFAEFNVAFELPWPWGGERFELSDIRPINYIVGPLGSGKTRLAQRLAETLPNAAFLGLERLEDGGAVVAARLDADPALKSRVDQTLAHLVDEDAAVSDALIALLAGLEAEGPAVLVVDMVEQGLDQATQEALVSHLRQRAKVGARPLFLMTRSSVILDLATIGSDEAILFCPANHSPPTRVAPYPGAPGCEAVATCLASPDVRARTSGVIAWRPPIAPEPTMPIVAAIMTN
jgi:DNA-binding transcriptional MerR regulator